ncbi:nucleolus and neural progenitor protein isoform X2 [Vanacampus margaritifer]
MAQDIWNRTHVLMPSAISSVRAKFTEKTGMIVKNLLTENDKVLKVLQSKYLQTEVRVLYVLRYDFHYSARSNKTFRVLKQLEQCINRLKKMKLDVALQSLKDLCPNMSQCLERVEARESDLPSQPTLEWQCLKVLGAAQLMSCALKRCSRAFVLSKQHMRHEFIILNMVITSMLSRFWVIFRGILTCLSALYQHLLELRAEVALARPMPFLTDFKLPADMAHFLDPSDAALLVAKTTSERCVAAHRAEKESHKPPVTVDHRRLMGKVKEDLGVAVRRELLLDASVVRVQTNHRTVAKMILPQKRRQCERERVFQRHTKQVATFKNMSSSLDKMILWCKSHKMNPTKLRLTFLRLKCRQMRSAEAAGCNLQKKLRAFKREARRAFCGVRGPLQKKTTRPSALCRRRGCLRTRLTALWRQFRSSRMRNNATKRLKPKKRASSMLANADWLNTTTASMFNNDYDDIDDIFASVGL